MKKLRLLILLVAVLVMISSCSKPVVTGSPVNGENAEQHGKEELELPNEEKDLPAKEETDEPQKEVPMPVKESLKVPAGSITEDKIYYRGKAVVLTYHHISEKPVSSITIKPQRFESDLKMLKENNFNVVHLRDVIKAMQGEDKLPPNAVVITFDDGYESVYKYAYPLLKKYGMPATTFVITSWTENYTPSGKELNSLGPDEIREMHNSGLVDIQSHSHDGHDYIVRNEKGQLGGKLAYQIFDKASGKYEEAEIYSGRVLNDLSKSIPIIEKYTGIKPDIFCFPFGHYNSRLVEIAKKSGFKYFVTTAYGDNRENSKSNMIRRIRSGDAKLTSEKLKSNIITCGQGKRPVTR